MLANGNIDLLNCISGVGKNPVGGMDDAPVVNTKMSSKDRLKASDELPGFKA